mmetsp:Transcript_35837/g.94158  ORF Transcript_35837/g.94158 Transcript_35837/m.94158 type:complete len:321 (+) Transcript_35837:136-1098(+)|eukprot:CAMPEP_0115860810 /NCGR_PEP_ID=MMETSP0287-20121206/17322_1 /TAXON_ID=412157 /ORGANISM="Chrysochromulina rotalis, Strain UIO044" /LENGTH=320 /DNA_ID=CAMNT_0003315151 /DNA_START=92 /DNA_END=1054 /DNA_ORIENTATION=-
MSREDEESFPDPGAQVLSLLKPVSVTMALVVFLVHEMGAASQQIRGGFSDLMIYQESATDSAGTVLSGVALNSLVIVLTLFGVTSGLLILYRCHCYRIIYGWLFLSVVSLLYAFGGYVLRELLMMHDVPIDSPTFLFFLWNFAAVGTLMVFWTEYGCGPSPPLELQQAYLIIISALLAWSATRLPEWSTLGLLAAVALWDLYAVLTPSGPLKLLVEEAEMRGDPIPGLVYQGADIKLGLGDFVFYAVLVGRASYGGSAVLLACAVAILAGLCATLALLPILQRVLPALPISIAVGIIIYFLACGTLTPLSNEAAIRHVFL